MKPLFIDIETGSLPEAELLTIAPEFLPAANLKDPEKIKVSIAEKRAAWIEKAALDALTGRVLAVTFAEGDGEAEFFCHDEEAVLLRKSLETIGRSFDLNEPIIGFNIRNFDLPFLIRRAWIKGVPVPRILLNEVQTYRSDLIVDLLQVWLAGSRDFSGQSLGNICKRCGLGEKNGDGKDFAKLLAENPEQAKAYALNDLELTRKLAHRMGF
jgi:DNA polymerase elongation subunit (family B)